MSRRWRDAPTWVLSVVLGTYFGLFMTIFGLVEQHGNVGSDVGGVIAGVLFGAFMGPYTARQRAQQVEVAGSLAPEIEQAARRAVLRGPIPNDPETRAAATRFAHHHLEEFEKWRAVNVAVSLVLLAGSAVLATTDSPWLWFLPGLLIVVMGRQLWRHRRLTSRIKALAGPSPKSP